MVFILDTIISATASSASIGPVEWSEMQDSGWFKYRVACYMTANLLIERAVTRKWLPALGFARLLAGHVPVAAVLDQSGTGSVSKPLGVPPDEWGHATGYGEFIMLPVNGRRT